MKCLNPSYYRLVITGGKPRDLMLFLEETVDFGMVWWHVPLDYKIPLAHTGHPFSCKMGSDDEATLLLTESAAKRHNITMRTRDYV